MIKDLLAHIAQSGSQTPIEGASAQQDSNPKSGVFGAMLASVSRESKKAEEETKDIAFVSNFEDFDQGVKTIVNEEDESLSNNEIIADTSIASEELIQNQSKTYSAIKIEEPIEGEEIETENSPQKSEVKVNEAKETIIKIEKPVEGQEIELESFPQKSEVKVNQAKDTAKQPIILDNSNQESVDVRISDSSKVGELATKDMAPQGIKDANKIVLPSVEHQKTVSSPILEQIPAKEAEAPSENTFAKTAVIEKTSIPISETTTKLEQTTPFATKRDNIEATQGITNAEILRNEETESTSRELIQTRTNSIEIEKREAPVLMTRSRELPEEQKSQLNEVQNRELKDQSAPIAEPKSLNTKLSQTQIPKNSSMLGEQTGTGETKAEKHSSEIRINENTRRESQISNLIREPRLTEVRPEPRATEFAQAHSDRIPEIKMEQTQTQTGQQIQPNATAASFEFGNVKNPELIQVIQNHKSEVVKPKEINNQKFALSMSEQAETRLKLLIDSVRPEILPAREVPVGFISSSSIEEGVQFYNPELTLTNDQELMLQEFMTESIQGKDQKSSEQSLLGFMRLGELPVLNSAARRTLVSSFAKVLQQEVSTPANQHQENWQKHSFKLDDGNNIDMTTRNIDGVLHIKLAASNPELNRLLQNMEQELKDHLKEELNLELDLQFENREEAFEQMLGDSSGESKSGTRNSIIDRTSEETGQEQNTGLQPSIRNFGYNQMEWTA